MHAERSVHSSADLAAWYWAYDLWLGYRVKELAEPELVEVLKLS